jgi:hypothetical protein
MIAIVGLGGIGAWLANVLARTVEKPETFLLIDGDTVESKNLDRQFFTHQHVGQFKADVVAEVMRHSQGVTVNTHTSFLDTSTPLKLRAPLFFSCPDNHAARFSTLQQADRLKGCAILAGNETWDSEAMFYKWNWRGTKLDPRVYHPEISPGNGERNAPCTGQAQIDNPQLAAANFIAASMCVMLYQSWFAPIALKNEDLRPIELRSNGTTVRKITKGDVLSS